MPPKASRIKRIQRRAQNLFMTERCQISVIAPASGPFGGDTTRTTLYDAVPCRLISVNRNTIENMVTAGQEQLAEYYWLQIPYDQPIAIDHIVTHNGQDYEISQVEDALTDATYKRVLINRKDGD